MTSVTQGGQSRHIVMVAVENAVIPGGKVGGMADVIGELPPALVALGCRVSVVVPSHGVLHRALPSRRMTSIATRFRGRVIDVEVFTLESACSGVRQWVLHHDDMAVEPTGSLYASDPVSMPFATDASRFALFSRAAVNFIAHWLTPKADVIHCHDWHTGYVAILRQFDTASGIADTQLVFSIHNLAYQGVRPFDHDTSSLSAWYSDIGYDGAMIADPRWPWCVNPMLAGIRLSDRVHVVSPTYAREVLSPNDVDNRGFHGGEGLQAVLRQAHDEGRLFGILNGCNYPPQAERRVRWADFCQRASAVVKAWHDRAPRAALAALGARIDLWHQRRPSAILTAVTRLAPQKLALALTAVGPTTLGTFSEVTALEHILASLEGGGVFVLLGNGDEDMERQLNDIARRHEHFIFLNGFSPTIADDLYAVGDLFVMPSSFEPCGLSQMFAMRAGQPCLVHAVGGLKDTVIPDINGLTFNGDTISIQARSLVDTARRALALLRQQPAQYAAIREKAKAARFLWSDTAAAYLDALYTSEEQARRLAR